MDVYPLAAQNEAVQRCKDILGEHFSAFSIITLVEGQENEESELTQTRYHHYDGGFSTVLGMLDAIHHKMRMSTFDPRE